MDMKRGAAAISTAVITCVAGCATKPAYVPPAAGEPQATIHRQPNLPGSFFCTSAHLFTLDDQKLPNRYWERAPINPGPHTAIVWGAYGLPGLLGCFSCHGTLQFTAEPSHDYQLLLVKEGDPYHIDLIDSETNRSVASAPCPGLFQTEKKPQTPDSGTDEGVKDEFLKR